MEGGRRCTSVRQLELLVEFLEEHKDLALGRVRSKEARALGARLWAECAEILNSEGPARTAKEWSKVWNDLKCRVRAKLVSINASQRATGGGPNTSVPLTPIEERVANILGRDVGPLPNVQQDHFNTNLQNTQDIIKEELEERLNEEEILPIALESTETDMPITPITPVSPVPSESGQVPLVSPGSRVRGRRRIQRASRQPMARPAPAQSSRTASALEQSRQMILEIERLRAQADLKMSETMLSNSESFRLIAQSIHRFAEKYCQQQ